MRKEDLEKIRFNLQMTKEMLKKKEAAHELSGIMFYKGMEQAYEISLFYIGDKVEI